MNSKSFIQIAIIIIQLILFASGIILWQLKIIDSIWPFTIVIWLLCFICILIGVLK